jgi:hypothetical protein
MSIPSEPGWLRQDHIRVGSDIETFIHIARTRPLTDAEREDRDALRAWSDKRAALARRLFTSSDHDWFETALAELGRAPMPRVRPERPGRDLR